MLIGMIIAVLFNPGAFRKKIHPFRTPAQRHFPQCRQVIHRKKVLHGLLRLGLFIDVAAVQPLRQFLRFDIHQFDLIRIIKHRIGNPFPDHHARNRCHGIIQAFNMLDVHRRINIDPCLKQFFHILIPLRMTAALRIRMGQLIHQNKLGLSPDRRVQVKFP